MAPEATKKLNLNFSEGTALRCLDQIVRSNDIMEARNRIRASQEVGKTLRQELEDAQPVSLYEQKNTGLDLP